MYVIQILKHSPESCPLGRPENLEDMKKWLENIGTIAEKHGIKLAGVWTDRWGHTSWAVYETPNMDTFAKFELEPANLNIVTFNHIETRRVTSAKETLAFFKRHQQENTK
ncbi:MAG: hypothetical protein N3D85_04470 [Candidatus Bathyarchaeota archaeon]|nr:hypothetical protein [Candidatus Bathyarchaeota archaeon]